MIERFLCATCGREFEADENAEDFDGVCPDCKKDKEDIGISDKICKGYCKCPDCHVLAEREGKIPTPGEIKDLLEGDELRPMTKGEKEIAKELDKEFEEEENV